MFTPTLLPSTGTPTIAIIRRRGPTRPLPDGTGGDPCTQITLAARELRPWRCRLDFLVYSDGEGNREYVPAGGNLDWPPGLRDLLWKHPEHADELDTASHRFRTGQRDYAKVAEQLDRGEHGKATATRIKMLRLDWDLITAYLADHNNEPGPVRMLPHLAKDRSTIWRKLDAAERAGAIPPGVIPRRSRTTG